MPVGPNTADESLGVLVESLRGCKCRCPTRSILTTNPRRGAEAWCVDPLGGAAVHYWGPINETYGLNINVVNPLVDPTFSFMTVDRDGKIRMDCSSPYAMVRLVSTGAYVTLGLRIPLHLPDLRRHRFEAHMPIREGDVRFVRVMPVGAPVETGFVKDDRLAAVGNATEAHAI